MPFYLMETLGGSNIRSDDTLRGFRDYRFRDRDLMLLQIEYLRELYGPIDFIAFYDTGKVAPSIGRLDEGRLRIPLVSALWWCRGAVTTCCFAFTSHSAAAKGLTPSSAAATQAEPTV